MQENEESDTLPLKNEAIVSCKFVIILSEVRLDVSKPIQLIIKYKYTIFSKEVVSTRRPLQILPEDGQNHRIPNG